MGDNLLSVTSALVIRLIQASGAGRRTRKGSESSVGDWSSPISPVSHLTTQFFSLSIQVRKRMKNGNVTRHRLMKRVIQFRSVCHVFVFNLKWLTNYKTLAILYRNPDFCLLLSDWKIWQHWPTVCMVPVGEIGRSCFL